ncbi:MAG: cohesin domain-containing protein [Candidatus Aminicenantes bacterium]|nr:cohesin domain-containing protein [Candidatus Aminicenantes bacterium]
MTKTLSVALACLVLGACVTFSPFYKAGVQAELNRKWDEAIAAYERAALENPKEAVYRVALFRAKAMASLATLHTARTLEAAGNKEEAVAAYRKALAFDPLNRQAAEELAALTAPPPKETKPKLAPYEPPVKLKVPTTPVRLKFAEASLKSIFQTMGKSHGINFIYDEQFRDRPLTVDISDRTFEQTLGFLCMTSQSFFRVVDEKTVLIVPDQPMKRLQYETNVVRTFYLSNLNAPDIVNVLNTAVRSPLKAPQIFADKNLNTITIRDTPNVVALTERLLKAWDKPPAEVLVDLEIMEVSRIKLRQLGLDLDANTVGVRYNDQTSAEGTTTSGWFNLKGLRLTESGNFEISLPTAYLQFLESDSDTKIIAQPRLRGIGGQNIEYLVGQRVPIVNSQVVPIAAGGIGTQPITNFTLQEIGINLKIKPRVHFEKEVTLEIDVEISSIAGTGVAGIPIIATRKVKNVVRLRNGETNLLAGLLRDEERTSLRGIAGLMNLPLVGRLFSYEDTQLEQTDVILTITPYIIRSLPLAPEDERPVWIDLEGISGSGGGGGGVESPGRADPGRAPGIPRAVPVEPDSGGENFVFFNPPNLDVPQGREFRVLIDVRNEADIGTLTLSIGFNSQVLRLKQIAPGGLVSQGGGNVPFLSSIDAGGSATIGFSSPGLGQGIKGGGTLAVLVFESVGVGETAVAVNSVTATAPNGTPIRFETNETRISVR